MKKIFYALLFVYLLFPSNSLAQELIDCQSKATMKVITELYGSNISLTTLEPDEQQFVRELIEQEQALCQLDPLSYGTDISECVLKATKESMIRAYGKIVDYRSLSSAEKGAIDAYVQQQCGTTSGIETAANTLNANSSNSGASNSASGSAAGGISTGNGSGSSSSSGSGGSSAGTGSSSASEDNSSNGSIITGDTNGDGVLSEEEENALNAATQACEDKAKIAAMTTLFGGVVDTSTLTSSQITLLNTEIAKELASCSNGGKNSTGLTSSGSGSGSSSSSGSSGSSSGTGSAASTGAGNGTGSSSASDDNGSNGSTITGDTDGDGVLSEEEENALNAATQACEDKAKIAAMTTLFGGVVDTSTLTPSQITLLNTEIAKELASCSNGGNNSGSTGLTDSSGGSSSSSGSGGSSAGSSRSSSSSTGTGSDSDSSNDTADDNNDGSNNGSTIVGDTDGDGVLSEDEKDTLKEITEACEDKARITAMTTVFGGVVSTSTLTTEERTLLETEIAKELSFCVNGGNNGSSSSNTNTSSSSSSSTSRSDSGTAADSGASSNSGSENETDGSSTDDNSNSGSDSSTDAADDSNNDSDNNNDSNGSNIPGDTNGDGILDEDEIKDLEETVKECEELAQTIAMEKIFGQIVSINVLTTSERRLLATQTAEELIACVDNNNGGSSTGNTDDNGSGNTGGNSDGSSAGNGSSTDQGTDGTGSNDDNNGDGNTDGNGNGDNDSNGNGNTGSDTTDQNDDDEILSCEAEAMERAMEKLFGRVINTSILSSSEKRKLEAEIAKQFIACSNNTDGPSSGGDNGDGNGSGNTGDNGDGKTDSNKNGNTGTGAGDKDTPTNGDTDTGSTSDGNNGDSSSTDDDANSDGSGDTDGNGNGNTGTSAEDNNTPTNGDTDTDSTSDGNTGDSSSTDDNTNSDDDVSAGESCAEQMARENPNMTVTEIMEACGVCPESGCVSAIVCPGNPSCPADDGELNICETNPNAPGCSEETDPFKGESEIEYSKGTSGNTGTATVKRESNKDETWEEDCTGANCKAASRPIVVNEFYEEQIIDAIKEIRAGYNNDTLQYEDIIKMDADDVNTLTGFASTCSLNYTTCATKRVQTGQDLLRTFINDLTIGNCRQIQSTSCSVTGTNSTNATNSSGSTAKDTFGDLQADITGNKAETAK